MIANAGFWANFLRQVYVRAIEGFRKGALEKIAPVFRGIAEEAGSAAEAEFEGSVATFGITRESPLGGPRYTANPNTLWISRV